MTNVMSGKPVREEREREFYSQLHCRHTRRAISPSKLVPILSNTYNERYTKENIHRQREDTSELVTRSVQDMRSMQHWQRT